MESHPTRAEESRYDLVANRDFIALIVFFGLGSDFHFMPGHPGFGSLASMFPPQWLDAAYLSYAWPDYFRRAPQLPQQPTQPQDPLCKIPGLCPVKGELQHLISFR